MAQTLLSFWKKPEPAPPEAEAVDEPRPRMVVSVKLEPQVLAALESKRVPNWEPKCEPKLEPQGEAKEEGPRPAQAMQPTQKQLHPFFMARNYKTPKTQGMVHTMRKWTNDPISHVGVENGTAPAVQRLFRRVTCEIEPPAALVSAPTSLQITNVSKARRHLVDTSPRTPFDFGRYERQMWCHKYAPKRLNQHIQPQKCREVAQWIKTQFGNLKRARPTAPIKRRKYDFVADDDDFGEDNFKPFLVVHGPPGSGKTTAVYTACGIFDALVIECNLTIRRTGAQLKEMLNGVIESHVVHAQDDNKWYHCAVLIEEADINLDQEQTFWPTLKEFAYKTRRPIIFTSETLDLPRNVINSDTAEFVAMGHPDPAQVVETSWKICTSEGFLIDKNELAKLVILFNGDIRRTLVHLQFWLQMGVGGSRGGAEWFKKAHEQGRVVSANNYFEIPLENVLQEEPTDFEGLVRCAESVSQLAGSGAYIHGHAGHDIDAYSFFECPTDNQRQLVCELLPMMRDIARDDLDRMQASSGLRATRRSLASFGLQRQVLNNPEEVISTFRRALD